jgi:hypothetical protein
MDSGGELTMKKLLFLLLLSSSVFAQTNLTTDTLSHPKLAGVKIRLFGRHNDTTSIGVTDAATQGTFFRVPRGGQFLFIVGPDTFYIDSASTLNASQFYWELSGGSPVYYSIDFIPGYGLAGATGLGNSLDLRVDTADVATHGYVVNSAAGLAFFGKEGQRDSTLAGNITLTSDMYVNSLTVPLNDTVFTNGWRVFVWTTSTINGVIDRSGKAGGAGTAGATNNRGLGGTAGAALAGGYLAGSAAAQSGGNGTYSSNTGTTPTDGTALTTQTNYLSQIGTYVANYDTASHGRGGAGGKPADSSKSTHTVTTGTGVAGFVGGIGKSGAGTDSVSITYDGTIDVINGWRGRITKIGTSAQTVLPVYSLGIAGGGGGGAQASGSGGSSYEGGGGGGGASGSNGAYLMFATKTLIGSGHIQALGGDGGAGGTGGQATRYSDSYVVDEGGGGGGGGGGNGGDGGVVIVIYHDTTGWSGTISGAGGNGGTGGVGGALSTGYILSTPTVGVTGQNGRPGRIGLIYKFKN